MSVNPPKSVRTGCVAVVPAVNRSGSAAAQSAAQPSGGSASSSPGRASRTARRSSRSWCGRCGACSIAGRQLVRAGAAPSSAMICCACATVACWYRVTRCVLSATSSARARRGSWVATPTGQLVGVALLRLDAADGHHHRPGRVRVVGALRDALDDVDAGRDLAAGADPDPVAQAGADQRVVHHDQPVGQGHADVVLVLQRRRAGAALGAVDDDEVRGDLPLRPSPCRSRATRAGSRRTA